ncbi:MAG: DsrE family protein [Candidatus Magnetominusculus sp. LBB02]|nr:DsrE family protein [Candidatus Magnetominusculus sp. LBB02]
MSKQLRVLFHVNEMEKWETALGNITNLIKDVGRDGAEIRVVANGPSVAAFSEASRLETMRALSEEGAVFMACRNSLKKMCAGADVCVTEQALPPFIKVIRAGITEIVRSQSDGFAYVKP